MVRATKKYVMQDFIIFLRRPFVLILFLAALTPASAVLLKLYEHPLRPFIRAYNNPYHPEDDAITEDLSDSDGDNLRFSFEKTKADLLSKEDKADIKSEKKVKINGRYWAVLSEEKDDRLKKFTWKFER